MEKLDGFLTLLLNFFIVSTTPLALKTFGTVNRTRTTSIALPTVCDQVTPVGDTRRQESPLSDVSNGKFLDSKYN